MNEDQVLFSEPLTSVFSKYRMVLSYDSHYDIIRTTVTHIRSMKHALFVNGLFESRTSIEDSRIWLCPKGHPYGVCNWCVWSSNNGIEVSLWPSDWRQLTQSSTLRM
eukprot:957594_1